MNTLDNVERRDTSGHDKTAGSSFREQQEYADCVRRHRQAYDVSDLAEEIDQEILDIVKNGWNVTLGDLLIKRMNATIARRVAAEGWK